MKQKDTRMNRNIVTEFLTEFFQKDISQQQTDPTFCIPKKFEKKTIAGFSKQFEKTDQQIDWHFKSFELIPTAHFFNFK